MRFVHLSQADDVILHLQHHAVQEALWVLKTGNQVVDGRPEEPGQAPANGQQFWKV